jgi:hypothetical protein
MKTLMMERREKKSPLDTRRLFRCASRGRATGTSPRGLVLLIRRNVRSRFPKSCNFASGPVLGM